MEKPFNEKNDKLKQWMQELPLESPSLDFTKKVMQGISAKSELTQYKPLISKRAWWLIGILLLFSIAYLYINPTSGTVPEGVTNLLGHLSFENPIKKLVLPKTAIYAIGFMALFLLQVPFLKRLHDKQYQ